MTVSLTQSAQWALGKNVKEPNIVLEIDGVTTIYSAILLKKALVVGDPDFFIGQESDGEIPIVGGTDEVDAQDNALTFDGTTTQISQLLQIDLGQGGSITNLSIALMDNGEITKLITPGQVIADILQARCKVYLGFDDTIWPDDYIAIFRGVVSDVTSDAGKVVLTLSHPDDKKQGSTYKVAKPKLSGAIDNVVASIAVDSVLDSSGIAMLAPVTGPDGTIDSSYESLILVDSEVIKYTGITGNTLTGCVRGYLNTTAAAHSSGADVQAMHRLKGDPLTLALKIMASTGNGAPYLTGLAASSFVNVDGTNIANAIYFKTTDIVAKYNVQVGDFVTVTGATNGANNITLKAITDIIETPTGSYILVDYFSIVGVPLLVVESTTAAVVSFRSQYDTLPDGLGLINDDIDIDQHNYLKTTFALGAITYDFRVKDNIDDTRTFLEQQVYSPVACFSLPTKSRCSVGYHIGPLPGQNIKTFDQTNIKNPSKVKLQRTTNRNFYNEILYQFDEDLLTSDQYNSANITISAISKAQIKNTDKTLIIQSKGLRTELGAVNVANAQANRRLSRYQYAAELISFGVLFSDGFNVEIGDIVWVDLSQMYIPDIKTGKKGMAGRYFFVQNKKLNLKTGDVKLDCLDTKFGSTGRYGLISPASQVLNGTNSNIFTIQASFSKKFGTAEHKKWTNLIGCTVRVRSADFSLSAETTLVDASTNTISVAPALPWTPSTGMIMEFVKYDDQVLAGAKLIYVHMSNTVFPDGKSQFLML